MLNFPWPSSKQMSHYIDMHLKDKSNDPLFCMLE